MISVFLAEDQNMVRIGIRSLLEKDATIQISGEGVNGLEALELLKGGIHADIILIDVNMPGMSGMELITQVKDLYPQIGIIILSMFEHEKYLSDAFNAGASGYLLKNVSADEMIFSIKHIANGGKYLCSELSFRLLDKLIYANKVPDKKVDFSKRELEILALIAEGYTNSEIADKLFTSKRTVEGHRQSLIDKTGVRNTAALIKYSIINGVIN